MARSRLMACGVLALGLMLAGLTYCDFESLNAVPKTKKTFMSYEFEMSNSNSNSNGIVGGSRGKGRDRKTNMPSAPVLAIATVALCWCIASTELHPFPPPMSTPIERRFDYGKVLLMSAFLSALSGMVNAICILDMSMTVAHHTGNASHLGRLYGIDHERFLAAMAGFCGGAFVSGFCKCDGETLYAGNYSAGLLSASIAVAGAVAVQYTHRDPLIAVPLLAFSQGLQNAVTRKFSSLPICTTHMTGYLTDLGSLMGAWCSAFFTGDSPAPNLKRPLFFFLSIFAFVAGGFVAKQAWDGYGILAALAPAALMAVTSLGLVFPSSWSQKV